MKKIGFLGGGQLARMMILEAHRMGLEPHVLCEKSSDPAAQVTSHFHSSSSVSISQFVNQMDLVTFESEFVSTDDLKSAEHKVFPEPHLMRTLQNRKTQKELLEKYKIPTSPWISLKKPDDLKSAAAKFQNRFVLKTNYGGYDGYGTFFCRSAKDLSSLESELKSNNSFIAEKLILFKRELACILVRNANGEIISLPLVETKQVNGRCDTVMGPIKHPRWKKMEGQFKALLKKENYVGCFAIEMFDTGKELFVNELAPRVHNSGHYSQEALVENQFTLHLKAGLGEKLNAPQLNAPAFVSLNLLGQDKEFVFPKTQMGILHWYGKSETRKGRKMGHVNFLGKSLKSLLPTSLKERKRYSP